MNEHHHWHLTWLGSDRLLARRFARPAARFLRIEAAGGVLLLAGALLAVVWANSPWSAAYHDLWHTEVGVVIGSFSLEMGLIEWVNDGLMALFFFVVGIEIKREMVSGELRDPRAAALPVLAAAGGMLVPALIYLALNGGGAGAAGWGIPMATDIAFAVGIVSLLGQRVPPQLKLFLLTLAVADDLGAIAVIAFAYSDGLAYGWLAGAVAVFVAVALLRRAGVWYLPIYVALGVVAWYLVLRSGIHATIAGVVLGFLTPTRPLNDGVDAEAIANRLENRSELTAEDVRIAAFHIKESVPVNERLTNLLHPWTSYVIVPAFALANAGVALSADALTTATSSPVTIGVLLGLFAGKTVGVASAAWLAARVGLARLPRSTSNLHLIGIAMAAGIGFTVAIFVTGISLADPVLRDQAKIGIFGASLLAAVGAAAVLAAAHRRASPLELAVDAAEAAALFEQLPDPVAADEPGDLPTRSAPPLPSLATGR